LITPKIIYDRVETMEENLIDVYDNPFYYDVAFSFRDISREVDFFEKCIKKFSKTKVKKILDIGCGPCPYMEELAKRGYTFTGLDLSKLMLGYSLEKARKSGIKIAIIHADMRNFKAKEQFDFAFCMLGSVTVESNEDFLSHLDSMAACIRSGGLYLIDAVIQFDWTRLGSDSWTVIKNGLIVNVTWSTSAINYIEQKAMDRLVVEVIEDGKAKVFKTERTSKIIFPQEFFELVRKNGRFEFLGWYNNFDLAQPLEKAMQFNRPMTVLRRK
jgi:SAM-dependent methyltransferase